MEEERKMPINGEIIEKDIELLGEIPKINSLVNYQIGTLNFNDSVILDFIEFIKKVYSSENLDKRAEEVNKLLESGNVEVVYERLKIAKKNPAELNNLAKDLEDELKKIKKVWNSPFEKFDRAIKLAIGEIKSISSYLKEVEIDPLSETCRNNKFNTFTAPILEEVRAEFQSLYDKIDFSEFNFSQDPKYYNLGSKKADIYLIAKMELDFWARQKNEEILKEQEKARIQQLIQQDFKMWEKIDLPEYNLKKGTNWIISDISQEINAGVPKEEIYKFLDFKTNKLIKNQEEILNTRKEMIQDAPSSVCKSVTSVYNITFKDVSCRSQFEDWLLTRNSIKWNR